MSLLMHTLHVDLGERSYPLYIGRDLFADSQLLAQHVAGSQVVIISNDTIAPLYVDKVRQALGERSLITEVVLPDGEQYKTLDTLATIFDQVMGENHNRSTSFIAVGGGVVGDMAGFAAACYQRGVNFIQIPTTPACTGRFLCRWQDRGKSSPGQEHDRRVLPAGRGVYRFEYLAIPT